MGARGVKKKRCKDEDEMVSHVKTMSKAVVELVQSISVNKEDVETAHIHSRVQESERKEISETIELISEQKETIQELTSMLRVLSDRLS